MSIDPPRIRYRDTMSVAAYHLVHNALVAPRQRIQEALAALPVLAKGELQRQGVDLEEPCPICFVPLEAVFAEDEAAEKAREGKKRAGTGADAEGEREERGEQEDEEEKNEEKNEKEEEVLTGVTKLVGCGHVFCRRDLTQWIRSHHGNCPTCRHTFMDLRPVESEDDESSDGGEYVPDDFEDEEDDGFLDIDVDGYTDTDGEGEFLPVVPMELDLDALYADEAAAAAGAEAEAVDEEGYALGVEQGDRHYHHHHDAFDRDDFGDSEMGDDFADADEDEDVDIGDEWGLTDGESESMSSADEMMGFGSSMGMGRGMGMGMGRGMPGGLADDEAPPIPDREVSVSAHEDDADLDGGVPFASRDAGLSVSADGALANAQEEKTNANEA